MLLKSQKLCIISIGISYLCFVVSTFLGAEFAIELFSALTAIFTGTVILTSLQGMGTFYIPSLGLSIGIYCWALADVIRFANHYILGREPLSLLVRSLYLMPNYCFSIALTIYLVKKLRGRSRELSYLLANAFCVSGIAIVLIIKFMSSISDTANVSFFAEIRAMMYFFINFFIVLVAGHMFRLIGFDKILRGTSLILFGILFYMLFDFHYTYREAIGEEPENVFTNLVYMLFMIILSMGVVVQSRRHYVYDFKRTDFSNKAIRGRVIVTILSLAGDIAAFGAEILTLEEMLYIAILLMAYMVMIYILRADILNETLLDQQRKQNEVLEAKVSEKTRELKEVNEHLEKLSSTDLLTGLYNRRYGYDYLDRLHDASVNGGGSYAIFCIDLNGFKPINDTYGHEMGDRVLRVFAERMRGLPDRYVTVRTGGDEFMLIMNRNHLERTVEQEAADIQELFHRPMYIDTYEFRLSASIGVSCYPEDGDGTSLLIQYADEAMYVVKHSDNKDGYLIFDASLVMGVKRNQRLREQIRVADPEKEFVIRYQPQYDVVNHQLVGVEIFPYLKEENGDISPSVLVPLAEELGLMNSIGVWLTGRAMEQISEWNKSLGRGLMITINLSALQIIDNDYIDFLEHIGEQYGIPASDVTLDVDNEVILGSVETSKMTLMRLRKQGFKLSLNNFGGGDINLSHVMECGFDGLKLSRNLVADALDHSEAVRLIRSIITLARSMDMEVTAVGIENEEYMKKMQELGVTIMQGYYFGRPVLAGEFSLANS